jgi:hypothetical protein
MPIVCCSVLNALRPLCFASQALASFADLILGFTGIFLSTTTCLLSSQRLTSLYLGSVFLAELIRISSSGRRSS